VSDSNTLIARQTVYSLARSVNDANFGAQISLNKLYALLAWNDPVPDEIYTECGATLAQLRQAVSKLETFLVTLSEQGQADKGKETQV